MIDKTGELRKTSHSQMSSKRCLLKFCDIHRKTLVLESLFIKTRLQHRCFSVNIAKNVRQHFFIEHLCLKQSIKDISRNTASKFEGHHAAQLNFCRYEGFCLASKTKITAATSNGILLNFTTATFENNFLGGGGRAASEKKTGGEGRAVTLVVSVFLFFQGSYLSRHETIFMQNFVFSLHKILHGRAFQLGLCY